METKLRSPTHEKQPAPRAAPSFLRERSSTRSLHGERRRWTAGVTGAAVGSPDLERSCQTAIPFRSAQRNLIDAVEAESVLI